MTFESVDNVQSCDSLSLGVFGVSDSVSDDVFKENLQNTSSFLVNEPLPIKSGDKSGCDKSEDAQEVNYIIMIYNKRKLFRYDN